MLYLFFHTSLGGRYICLSSFRGMSVFLVLSTLFEVCVCVCIVLQAKSVLFSDVDFDMA